MPSSPMTIPPEMFSSELAATRREFDKGRTKGADWRRRQLQVRTR